MDYNVDNIEAKPEIKPTMDTDIVLHKDGKFQRAKIFGFDGKIKKAYVEAVINETINNNTYELDPEQIVPSEALYNDTPETLAGDVLKRVDKTTGIDVNYRETTVWDDGTAMTDAKADGVIYIKKGVKYYKRQFSRSIDVRWFGAKGDGVTNSTLAFKNMFSFLNKTSDVYNVDIPSGTYKINETIEILPNKNGIGHHIFGNGSRETILDFSAMTNGVAVKINGDGMRNYLNGYFGKIVIKANQNVDGIQIKSVVSSAGGFVFAYNTIEDIFIKNSKNGFEEVIPTGSGESTLPYQNTFKNINVETYYGIGINLTTGYSIIDTLFIVQPSGQTDPNNPNPNYGALNLGLLLKGSNNTVSNIQMEDQFTITGSSNTILSITQEYIIKAQMYNGTMDSAFSINGAYNNLINVRQIGLKNSLIQNLGSVFTPTTIIGFTYDESGPGTKILYPILCDSGSLTLINAVTKTNYDITNPALNQNKTVLINYIEDSGNVVSRVPNMIATTASFGLVKQAAADPNSTATDVSGVVTDLNDLLGKLRTAGIIAT